MAITREEVLHVAKLASLELTDEEVERLTGELSAILEAVFAGQTETQDAVTQMAEKAAADIKIT